MDRDGGMHRAESVGVLVLVGVVVVMGGPMRSLVGVVGGTNVAAGGGPWYVSGGVVWWETAVLGRKAGCWLLAECGPVESERELGGLGRRLNEL